MLVEGNYLSLPMDPWSQLKELFDERWCVCTLCTCMHVYGPVIHSDG